MRQFKDELKQGSESSNIPKELMDYFNQSLPGNLKYVQQSDHLLMVDHKEMKATCFLLEKENEKWLKKYRQYFKSPMDPLEIMTLTQTPLVIGVSDTIECDGIVLPSELLVKSITDKKINSKLVRYILPNELPTINDLHFSIVDKEYHLTTTLKLQKCENIEWFTYNNFIENKAFKISITFPSKYYSGEKPEYFQISIEIDKTKAKTIEEAIIAYELYSAFLNSQLRINGEIISVNNISDKKKDEKQKMLRINLKLLNAVKLLENELNTKLSLSKEIDNETIEIILKLYVSLIKKKAYKEDNHDTISFINKFDDISKTDSLKNTPAAFITSGTLTVDILGTTLDLFYATCYFYVTLKDVEETSQGEYKLTFDCTDDKCYISSKIFLDKDTMLSESKDHFVKYFSDATILESIDNVID